MTGAHDIAYGRPRNGIAFLAAVLLAAVTAAASFALAMPERASAGSDLCPTGHFCIWEHAGFKGGMYNSSGSNPNLRNDFFFKTSRRVANKGTALFNNGNEDKRPRGRDDVVLYMSSGDDDLDLKYRTFCLHRGSKVRKLTPNWNDRIVGYRWATDRQCRDAGLG